MTPTELNFDGTPVDPDQDQEPEAPEPQPEPEPEPEPDDLEELKQAVSALTEWARSQQNVAPQAIAPAAPQRPRPNFGENTAAAALWDRIEEVDRNNQERWNQAQQQQQAAAQAERDFTTITNMAEKHAKDRVRSGDPEVSRDAILEMAGKMGLLRNASVPFEEGIELAYNAVAFKAAKDQARNQGVRDARSPTAKVPAAYHPTPRPTQSREPVGQNGRPVDKIGRLKQDAEKALRDFSRLSPEERENAWG